MKTRWFNMLGACVLPPVVGVGFGAGVLQLLKEHDLTRLAPVVEATPAALRPHKGSPGAAEIRAALPRDATFDPDMPARMPNNADREAVKRAAEAAKARSMPKAPAKGQAEPEGTIATKPASTDHKHPAAPWQPPAWRAVFEPIGDYWTRLMPRTSALPQAYQAVLNDDPAQLARVIALGISPSEKTLGGDTPLCAAVRMGRVECVRVLALAGAGLEECGRENQAPIAVASLRRNAEVLEALLDAGADPNTRFKTPVAQEVIDRVAIKDLRNAMESDRGLTPLMCCASRGDVEGAIALLRGGAKPGICTTRYHRYPINFAATQRYLFLMRVLLGRDPDSEPNILVTVNLTHQRAWVTKAGRIINSTSVSTGREGYSTPAGRYVITDKHRSHVSTLYHVEMPWFMRLNCSAIGLHSGYVTGRPASHGCIRLPYEKAREFYHLVGVGDEVEIVH